MPGRSGTCVPGLAMVSTKTMRVPGRSTAATASAEAASTRLTSTPRPCRVPSTLWVLPKRWRLATRWSPARSSVRNTAETAAMPVAKHTVPTPSSSAVILDSSAAVVGVPWRA